MTPNNNVLAFKGGKRPLHMGDAARQMIADCREMAAQTLATLTDGLFETLDDTLYTLADKANTNQLQSIYFAAMRLLRTHRGPIQAGFIEGVLRDFDALWIHGPRDLSPSPPGPPVEDSGLLLLEEEAFEESLAVTNLISKGENRFHRELYQLNRRFGLLLGDVEIPSPSNPLGPTGLCVHFHASLQGVTLETSVRLVVYKLFDKQIMAHAGGLYDALNTLLGRAGINPPPITGTRGGLSLPERTPTSGASRGSTALQPGKPPEAVKGAAKSPTGADQAAAIQGLEAELFKTLQSLLTSYRATQGRALPLDGELPTVGRPELLNGLSMLQQAGGFDGPPQGTERPGEMDLRGFLAARLGLQQDGQTKRTLEQADEDTLDVIAMIFDFLLTDPNLPDAIKALIARLQIPMLKVAILDKTFFSAKLHPARRLLNTLARAAVGWSDDGDRSPEGLYGHIEAIVQRIILTFEDDPAIFTHLNEEFAAYLDREQRGADLAEQRAVEITKGKEQLRMAKDLVAKEMERWLRLPWLPLIVRTLLEDGWKDVLLLTYLREGPESTAWKGRLKVADHLVWSVKPKTNQKQRETLLRIIPALLRQLRAGFHGISYDQNRLARLLKELHACHIACLRGTACGQEGFAPPAAERPADQEAAPTSPSSQDTELVDGLAVGTWLELQEEDGECLRVKLSLKSDVSNTYVFVNRKGVKVLEMTVAGVARLLRGGKAEMLTNVEVPIMDRAVDAMLATLQKTAPAPSIAL